MLYQVYNSRLRLEFVYADTYNTAAHVVKWNFHKYKLLLMDDTERTRLEGHRLRYHVKRIRKLLLSKQGKTLTKTSTICLPNPWRRLLRPVPFIYYSLNSHMFDLFITNNDAIVKAIGRHPS